MEVVFSGNIDLYVNSCIVWRYCLVIILTCILCRVLYFMACIVCYEVYCMEVMFCGIMGLYIMGCIVCYTYVAYIVRRFCLMILLAGMIWRVLYVMACIVCYDVYCMV